jgi:biopolymer transport protein ExbB
MLNLRMLFVLRVAAIAVVALVLGAPLLAQSRSSRVDDEERVATREEVSEAPPVEERNLFGVIQKGGVMMIPILACSFVMLVFLFERIISLRRGRVIPAPFVKRFMHQLREGKLDKEEALELCRESWSPVSEVFAGAVRRWGRPTVEIEQAILDAEERAAAGLRRYLRLFNLIANLGPLLGLLGTVFGMIRLFGAISSGDAMGRTELLAGGISEALMATASGLCVAIPALCFYVFFGSRVERLVNDMDLLGQELVALISSEALAEAKTTRANRRPTAA